MSKQLFMLDCDGTLMATIDAWHEAEKHIAAMAGIVLSKEERDLLNTYTLEEVSAFFHERYGVGESPDDVMRFIMEFMLNYYRTQAQPVPGAPEFVMSLREAGAALCVLSSSPHEFLVVGLERTGMLPYVDEVISVEDLAMTKRDPRTYQVVCERMGVAPRDAWLLDDSWYALEAAQKAGCRTVGVYSTDWCGTHEELARFSERVIDDFTGVSALDF